MNSLKDVKESARAILGDQDADWATDAYLIPMANHCYGLIILDLSETCSPYIEKVVTIPNLPIGTTDLSDYQNRDDGELNGLINPFAEGVDWKPAGAPDNYYRPVHQTSKLPDFAPPQGSITAVGAPGAMFFEFRAFILYVTAMAIAIDLRVRGEFRPPKLLQETDRLSIHPLMSVALAEQVAACAMRERSNAGQMQSFTLVGSEALDNIKNQLVRSQQGVTVRLGSMSNRGRGRRY
jgi:hypothetical protein